MPKTPAPPRRLVLVTWLDHGEHGNGGAWDQLSEHGAHKAFRCESVGWVTHEDDDVLVLTSSVVRKPWDGTVGRRFTLVKSAIVNVKEITS